MGNLKGSQVGLAQALLGPLKVTCAHSALPAVTSRSTRGHGGVRVNSDRCKSYHTMSLSIVPRHQALHRVRLVGARSATWSVVTGAHQCPAAASSDKTPVGTPEEARRVVIRIVPAKLPRRLAQPIRSQMPRGKLRSPRRDPSYAPICGDHRATPNASEPPISDTVGENAPETPQLYTTLS